MPEERRAVLVYQGGFANVFEVTSFNMADRGRDAQRLLQHAFMPCEFYARGLARAGWLVTSAVCNETGDITHAEWSEYLEAAPFARDFHPVYSHGVFDYHREIAEEKRLGL